MPNWCYTNYVIEGESKQIQSFKEKLDELNSMHSPLIENGFGKLWMGIIVHLLGKDWNTVRCRGMILDYGIENGGTLRLTIESAWSELNEVRILFHQKYPGTTVYYQSEEPGMEIYETNDTAGKYFTDRYIVDSERDGEVYFETLLEVAEYIQNITGITTEPTKESIMQSIDIWTGEDPDSRWISFHEFAEVE